MSMANVIAVSGAARNVVLLGDPQQLSQVKKGAHPEGVDLSSLEHVLAGEPVIDPRRGIFLPKTYRLHPDVNAFTSEVFYARQLQARRHRRPPARTCSPRAGLTGTGVRWLPVVHAGNRNSSEEEDQVVKALYRDLLGGRWTDVVWHHHAAHAGPGPDRGAVQRPGRSPHRTAPGGRGCGGRDAEDRHRRQDPGSAGAVVIYSMATSSQDELPRTLEFLYSLNRLNAPPCAAAYGRPGCSPDLLRVRVHTAVPDAPGECALPLRRDRRRTVADAGPDTPPSA